MAHVRDSPGSYRWSGWFLECDFNSASPHGAQELALSPKQLLNSSLLFLIPVALAFKRPRKYFDYRRGGAVKGACLV
jgi:hypothetical protein